MKMIKIDEFCNGFLGVFSRKITKVDKIETVSCDLESIAPDARQLIRNFLAFEFEPIAPTKMRQLLY